MCHIGIIMHAVIAGDIVAYTSLKVGDREQLEGSLDVLFSELEQVFSVAGWMAKGDFLEFYVPNKTHGLRAMLAVKTFVRSQSLGRGDTANKKAKLHNEHGIRLALSLGELDRLDLKEGLIDGAAIYQAGRLLGEEKTHDKQRVTVKQTLFINAEEESIEAEFQPQLALIDELLMRSTAKQCEVVYHRLMGREEKEISKLLQRSQSTVNQHTTQAGWHAIESAVNRFESVLS